MDFERMLSQCGNNQRYQYLLLSLYGFLMLVVSMHFFSQNVISFVPEHWCYHEQLENRSFGDIAAIYAQFDNPSCTRLQSIEGQLVTVSSERCERWIYKYDFGYRSMNTELNWVCHNAYKARVGQSLFFVGSMCGTLFFGLLGDKIGRVKALILAVLCGFLGDFLTIFTEALPAFCFMRFVSGLAADANSYLMYILVLEYVSPALRNVGLNTVLGLCYCLGLAGSCWLAVYVGHWRLFLLCSSLPLLLVTSFYYLVQESAQWLVTSGDIEGAIKRLQRVAKVNRRLVSSADFIAFRSYCQLNYHENAQATDQLLDMLKTPRLRSIAIKLLLIYIIIYPCYNTIARNVEGLGISPFIMFSLNALMLPPSGYLQGWLQESIGRKATAVSWMLIGGLLATVAAVAIAQQPANAVVLVCLMLALRFAVSVADGASCQFATELIPTSVRARGVAVTHVAGFASAFLSPYILHVGLYYKPAPSMIVVLLFLLGGYVCLLLPETRHQQLPMSLAEGEHFGKGERWYDFLLKLRSTGSLPVRTEMDMTTQQHKLLALTHNNTLTT